MSRHGIICFVVAGCAIPAFADFVNWETPHVRPLEMLPDGSKLLAVNTPDNRLEVFDLTTGTPVWTGSIFVGLDPVSVRARSNSEAWVANHISDSVSIVDLVSMNVVATLSTADEPTDIVFAGSPERAFVTCSQVNQVMVFDPDDLSADPTIIEIDAEDPRAMAVSADGSEVYVAVFESGNGSTLISGDNQFFPSPLGNADTPHGGVNPPPNDGAEFDPPVNPALPAPFGVSLIVKKDDRGRWMDDNNGDWTEWISGSQSDTTLRTRGWDLPDRDLAIIDATTFDVQYVSRLMNFNMALAVNPATGKVTVVGTDATNEVRFEPILSGRFLRVNMATIDPTGPSREGLVDLNPHLDYVESSIPEEQRSNSLGDPRGIVWNAAGTLGYVTGMGSNNVVVIDPSGARVGDSPIEVGEGPTGIVIDEDRGQLYVLDKFESALSVVDLSTSMEEARVPFFDPSPVAIKIGRRHVYDTHATSGTGHIACASCHVDSRMDRLAWDLGDPSGEMKALGDSNTGDWNFLLGFGFEDWHPMKGPMRTQTLQDIIGKEPHHWRGDRNGLEEFAGAFASLMGDDQPLPPDDMQEFEDFLATIHFPPNPFRNLDNSLPTDLGLEGFVSTGGVAELGTPLPNGNAETGFTLFRPPNFMDSPFACSSCHTLPTGAGPNVELVGGQLQEIPLGPNGETHLGLNSVDGSNNVTMKIPQLRNLFEVAGMDSTQTESRAGFGLLHDGAVDTLPRFFESAAFPNINTLQRLSDIIAFGLALSGSDLPDPNDPNDQDEPPGVPSQDTHAAVGVQTTIVDAAIADPAQLELIEALVAMAEERKIGLVVKGYQDGIARGYSYVGGDIYQPDRADESVTGAELLAGAAPGNELTYTAVPLGTQTRIGVDRDRDGFFDRDELDTCSDPADPDSTPDDCPLTCEGDANGDGLVDPLDSGFVLARFGCLVGGGDPQCDLADLNGDGLVNPLDVGFVLARFGPCE